MEDEAMRNLVVNQKGLVSERASVWSDSCTNVEMSRHIFCHISSCNRSMFQMFLKRSTGLCLHCDPILTETLCTLKEKLLTRWQMYSGLQKPGKIGTTNKWPKKKKRIITTSWFLSLKVLSLWFMYKGSRRMYTDPHPEHILGINYIHFSSSI